MGDTESGAGILEGVEVGEGFHWKGLTVFPLRGPDLEGPDYVVAEEAFQSGTIAVQEVSQSGSVQEIVVENTGERPVLFVEGETLEGAKQNRTLNACILVGAKSRTSVPVSCVEAGRWGYRRAKFSGSPHMSHSKLRGLKSAAVSESLRAAQSYRGSQDRVWSEIADKARRLGMSSPTSAAHEYYEALRSQTESVAEELRPRLEGARGMVVVLGESGLQLDLFDRASTFARYADRLARSAIFEAFAEHREEIEPPTRERVTEEIRSLERRRDVQSHPSPGLGTDVRCQDGHRLRVTLMVEDSPVHTAVYTVG